MFLLFCSYILALMSSIQRNHGQAAERGRPRSRSPELLHHRSRSQSYDSRRNQSLESWGDGAELVPSAHSLPRSRSVSSNSDTARAPNKKRPLSPKPNTAAPNKRSSRPKVSDYDESTQALLTYAIHEFHCKISTIYAFPDTVQVMEFAVESWQAACYRYSIDMRLTPQMAKVVRFTLLQITYMATNTCLDCKPGLAAPR